MTFLMNFAFLFMQAVAQSCTTIYACYNVATGVNDGLASSALCPKPLHIWNFWNTSRLFFIHTVQHVHVNSGRQQNSVSVQTVGSLRLLSFHLFSVVKKRFYKACMLSTLFISIIIIISILISIIITSIFRRHCVSRP